jgi:hypothetical protein
MLRNARLAALFSAAALLLMHGSLAAAQSAPIPSQLLNAKTAFIANGGSTSPTLSSAELYSGIYTAVREWGKLILVNTPEEADLIFVATFSAPASDAENGTSFLKPQLTLSVQDPKTRVPLWTVTEYAWPKKAGARAYEGVVAQVRVIAEATHAEKPKVAEPAPVVKKEEPKAAEPKKNTAPRDDSKSETLKKAW